MTNQSKMKHSELPWEKNNSDPSCIQSKDLCFVARFDVSGAISEEEEEVLNRNFVLKACNSHYELLEACKRMVNLAERHKFAITDDVLFAKVAIKKAENE